ncbi:MAG: glycosyltransferase family 9 protein, partial [Gammaproteobacteria bacterium]|nr:glycosyltransferase family 9 protein [Gammaproteobacteria bacterium]
MKKILIIRNDKLGDFMLAYPSFALAKNNLPNTEIHALVPRYTQIMAESCDWIDKTIIDPGSKAGWLKNYSLLKQLKNENYDAVITLFSTTRIGLLTKLAGIAYRLAPATKLAQIFYNHKLVQRRSRSEKPEYAYNMDLVYHYLEQQSIKNLQKPEPPYLEFNKEEITHLRLSFIKQHNIPDKHKLIFLHPGNGGSASNLT